MGISSLRVVVFLVSFFSLFGGRGGKGQLAGRSGGNGYPCQPFKANQTDLCSEIQALKQADGVAKFCNSPRASCNVNNTPGPRSRKDAGWALCYCDHLCKMIGDCCVDYDEWYGIRAPTEKKTPLQSCRRKPSNDKSQLLGYIMVANCPLSWKDASINEKCMSTNYTADPATALPILDMTENITYANIYCAICHNKTSDLHHWSLRIQKNRQRSISLHDIKSADVIWEAIPGGDRIPFKCIVSPINVEPDTTDKQRCLAYANAIRVSADGIERGEYFKNPHCAIISMQGNRVTLFNQSFVCRNDRRFPPRLAFMLFVFSPYALNSVTLGEETIRLEVSCPTHEIYDPFKGRCLPVHYGFYSNSANSTEKCHGPRFPSNEVLLLINNSAYIIPHRKAYNNDSYILVNDTLILCSSFSHKYNKTVTNVVTVKSSQDQSFTLRTITYVGFSLSVISLLLLLMTCFLFPEMRTYPIKLVMHLSCALLAMQSVYFVSDPDIVAPVVCAVMGGLLHYFILAVFLWMSAIAYNTQKTFTNPSVVINPGNPLVLEEKRKSYIIYTLLCWGGPSVAVGICITLQLMKIGNVGYGYKIDDGCQLSLPARTYAVAIPVSALLLFNIVALIRTAIAIKQDGQANVQTTHPRNLPVIVLRMTVVMGITWILGFAVAIYPTPFLEYPFIIVNSCQGVLISLSFVFKRRVFTLFKKRFLKGENIQGEEQ